MKMRHVSSVGVTSLPSQQSCSSGCSAWAPPGQPGAADTRTDVDVGGAPQQQGHQGAEASPAAMGAVQAPSGTGPRQAFVMKRLTRTDNRRYHTAGAVDDVKKAEGRDASIQKRFSWNYGPQNCAKRQERQLHCASTQDGLDGQDGAGLGHHQDVLFIDRATSPLEPPPQHITDAAWSHVHAGSTERNPFSEPVMFQSPSVGSSPSVSACVSLCGDCSPSPSPAPSGAGAPQGVTAAHGVHGAHGSVTSSPALSTSSPVGPAQLPSLNTSPTMGPGPGPMARSNPFLEDVVGQDMESLPPTGSTNPFLESTDIPDEPSSGTASDEVLVLITDAQTDQTTDA